MLVQQYGINVLALDQSENNIEQSKKIGKKESYVKNKQSHEATNSAGKYVATTMKLTQHTKLEEILANIEHFKTEKETQKFLLTGLHCCGGLSSTILRIFREHQHQQSTNSHEVKGLVLLSCCYHLAYEAEDLKRTQSNAEEVVPDFPMSNYVRKSGIKLGSGARLLACYGRIFA